METDVVTRMMDISIFKVEPSGTYELTITVKEIPTKFAADELGIFVATAIGSRELDAGRNAHRAVVPPEYEFLYAFDAAHAVEPDRVIAERIAASHGAGEFHPIVDDITHAIEDARNLGERRGKFTPREV